MIAAVATRVTMAQEALLAHEALLVVNASEPQSDDRDWLQWKITQWDPAYARFDRAMIWLSVAVGDPAINRDPNYFRPLCERIIGQER